MLSWKIKHSSIYHLHKVWAGNFFDRWDYFTNITVIFSIVLIGVSLFILLGFFKIDNMERMNGWEMKGSQLWLFKTGGLHFHQSVKYNKCKINKITAGK